MSIKTTCSNCQAELTVNTVAATVTTTTKAHGRGSKRVAATVTVADLYGIDGFYTWSAPCCPDYEDSLEVEQ